jgi:archaellum component FlaC
MNREDLVKEISRQMLPFVSKYNIRTDTLLDEIEDEILKGRMSDT